MRLRTSLTDPLLIAEIEVRGGGSVGVTFCPGKCGPSLFGHTWERDLGADLDSIQEWGASVVLTLVEYHELESLKVMKLGEEVIRRGMRWLHLSIVDVNIPSAEFEHRWIQELDGLLDILGAGGKVLVHCKGGLGRAGTVAALLLIETGEAAATAIKSVRAVRPGAIETIGQVQYVNAYTRMSASSSR